MSQQILCVDDDPNVLRGYQRHLRKRFPLEICDDARNGLEVIRRQGPFAVVVSDMRMPGMDGVQFLRQVREIAPDTVRMMLTGNADQQTAVDAVNDGCIFRFLSKPCSPDDLAEALEAGLAQYRLIRSERELLANTLNGSVKLLTEILSIVNPLAFGRAESVRRVVHQLCRRLPVENAWEVELAAMLSQVGCIAVPQEILNKVAAGGALGDDELHIFRNHPRIGADLIARIPRLAGVARIVAQQLGPERPDASGDSGAALQASQVLRLAIEVDRLLSVGVASEDVLAALQKGPQVHDQRLLASLSAMLGVRYTLLDVTVEQLEDGMIFDEHVETITRVLLVAKGREVVPLVRERLAVLARTANGVRQPIRVRCKGPGVEDASTC